MIKLNKTAGNQMRELKLNKMKTKTITMNQPPLNKKSTGNVLLSMARNLFSFKKTENKKETSVSPKIKKYPIYYYGSIDSGELVSAQTKHSSAVRTSLAYNKAKYEAKSLDILLDNIPSRGLITRKELLKTWGLSPTSMHKNINIFIYNRYLERVQPGLYRIIDHNLEVHDKSIFVDYLDFPSNLN